jgi:hypothetical protein
MPACGHAFFPQYNTEHHHSSLGLLPPRRALRLGRAARGRAGCRAHHGVGGPSRAVLGGPSDAGPAPTEVWINPPKLRVPATAAPTPMGDCAISLFHKSRDTTSAALTNLSARLTPSVTRQLAEGFSFAGWVAWGRIRSIVGSRGHSSRHSGPGVEVCNPCPPLAIS